MDTKKSQRLICLALFLFAFVLYGNTIQNQYALDDEMVTNNEQVSRGVKAIPEIFTTNYRITDKYNYGYRPITKSSFALEHQLFGLNPHISHFINVLIYAFTGVFLFLLLGHMLKGYHPYFPMAITLIFLAHPIHTEAVASLKNREELISFICSLAALSLLLKSVGKFRAVNIIGGILLFVIGFFAKQNTATFLMIIPLSIYFFTDISLPSIRRPKLSVREFVPAVDVTLAKSIIPVIGLGFFAAGMWWNVHYILVTLFLIFLDKWLAGRAQGGQSNVDIGYKQALIIGACYFMVILNDDFLQIEVIKPLYVLFALPYFLYLRDVVLELSRSSGSDSSSTFRSNLILLIGIVFFAMAELFHDRTFLLYAFVLLLIDISISIRLAGNNWKKIFVNGYAIAGLVAMLAAEYIYKILGIEPTELNEGWMLITYLMLSIYTIYFIDKNNLLARYFGKAKRLFNSVMSIHISKTALISIGVLASLAITTYLLMVLPTSLLPPEHREIFYFENPLVNEPGLSTNYGTAFYTLLIYIKLLFLPHPLLFYYGFDHIPVVDFTNAWVVFSAIIHFLLLVYALINLKRKHLLSYAILYYLATIIVFSNILFKIPGIVGERLLYMPSLGFCIVITYFIFKLLKLDPKSNLKASGAKLKLGVVMALIIIPYSVKTITRNADWENHHTLYLHDIPELTNSLYANDLVGSLLIREISADPKSEAKLIENQEKLKKAIQYFNQALKLDPNHLEALNNLGMIYYDFYQDYDTAVPYFNKILAIDSTFEMAYTNLASIEMARGNLNGAIEYYIQLAERNPDDINVASNLANMYFSNKNYAMAIEVNERMMKIDPTSPIPYLNIGNYYLQRDNEAKAVTYFEQAVELAPGNTQLCLDLSEYFQENGDPEKAKHYYNLSQQNK